MHRIAPKKRQGGGGENGAAPAKIGTFAIRACILFPLCQMILFLVYYHDDVDSSRHLLQDEISLLFKTKRDSSNVLRGGSKITEKKNNNNNNNIIPLRELVSINEELSCPTNDGLYRVNDTILDYDMAYDFGIRKIPHIVHVTSKTRCMPKEFVSNLEKWRFPRHSFFFHNEEAMEKLLEKQWIEFPQLQQALRCTKGGAGRADVWRALIMWEYGGIYTDIDNAPTRKFLNGNIISNTDDAFFVIEKSGILSQYFFASRPKHPLFYLLVQHMMSRLLALNDVEMQIVSVVTGPGALRQAFNNFMDGQGSNIQYLGGSLHKFPDEKYWYPTSKRIYTGMYNYTVRAVGHEDHPDEYVARDIIPNKNLIYKRMNMTYFRDIPKIESKKSCFQRIYKEEKLFESSSFNNYYNQSISYF